MTMNGAENVVEALYTARPAGSVLFRDPAGAEVTTGEARVMVRRMAAGLAARGVRPGDRVSLRLEKSVGTILLAHAVLWSGAILHPLNNAYTPHELNGLLADAKPRLLFVTAAETEALRPVAQAAGAEAVIFADWLAGLPDAAGADAWEPPGPQAGAVLLYTSGTTGKPKGALITHGNLLSSARALAGVWHITPDDVLLHALPVFHAHGLLTSINAVMAGGGSVLLLPEFEVTGVLAALGHATLMMGVPTQYRRLADAPGLGAAVGPRFRLAISGSAPLPADLAEDFSAKTGVPIIERYGSTEAAIVTAIPPDQAARRGWVGWALPGVAVRVATPDGPCPAGIGGLETRGENIFAGYWQNASATRKAFTEDGWFITGDIAEIDATGCVRLLGRAKEIVITGGLNVYPAEVEEALRSLPGVTDAAVFGVPHPDFGEAVVAAVEPAGPQELTEPEANVRLRERLAAYKTPKRILRLDALPRNAMGKVVKASLRETFKALFDETSTGKGKD